MHSRKGGTLLQIFCKIQASQTQTQRWNYNILQQRNKSRNIDVPNPRFMRKPIRVYMPGETYPNPKKPTVAEEEARIVKYEHSTIEKLPADILAEVMGEILNNPKRKNIALEGHRLIDEALKAGIRPTKLFMLKSIKEIPTSLAPLVDNGTTELIKVSQKAMEKWSSVTTPPGIIGVFCKPKHRDLLLDERRKGENWSPIPLTIICDNLRDPGNLGSIMRSAAAAGSKNIFLTIGCTDPWDTKVLRGACGAHFQIAFHEDMHISNVQSYIELQESSFRMNAPDEGTTKQPQKLTGVFLADSNDDETKSGLPLLSYTDVDFNQYENIYLIIGGETVGLSKESLQVGRRLNDCTSNAQSGTRISVARLHIPLQSSVESLNVANAFGIIAFEIRRQRMLDSCQDKIKPQRQISFSI